MFPNLNERRRYQKVAENDNQRKNDRSPSSESVILCASENLEQDSFEEAPIAKPTRAAMPLMFVIEPLSVWREKKNPITKLTIPKRTWPMNEHQKAVLKENWTRAIGLLNKSSRTIPTKIPTAASRMKYWEIIADNLKKAGWRCGCISSTDDKGRQFWVVAAEREDGGRFIVRADEKLTAFLELEIATSGQRVAF
jgi:hypothetical protein